MVLMGLSRSWCCQSKKSLIIDTIEAYQEGALRIVENIITLDIWWNKSKLCSTFTINDPESAGVSWDSRGIKLGHVYEDNLPEFESEEGWKRVLQREVGELLDGFA